MDIVVGNYRIRPYKGYTCWQIEKKGVVKTGATAGQEYWMSAELYPQTIGYACKLVFELNLRENPSQIDKYEDMMKQINLEISRFTSQLDAINQAAKDFDTDKKAFGEAVKSSGSLLEIEVEDKPKKRRGRPPKNKN